MLGPIGLDLSMFRIASASPPAETTTLGMKKDSREPFSEFCTKSSNHQPSIPLAPARPVSLESYREEPDSNSSSSAPRTSDTIYKTLPVALTALLAQSS